MSEILRQKASRSDATTARAYQAEVAEVDFGAGARQPTVTLSNGKSGAGVCLGCRDTPCMKKHKEENEVPSAFSKFPGDPSTDVCPTGAISWDANASAIRVSTADCVGCGLCIARCPYGAIHLDQGAKAKVNVADVGGLVAQGRPVSKIDHHPHPKRKGRIASTTATALKELDQAVHAMNDAQALLLVRNALHELGVQCRIRRRGDTNFRIDAIVAFESGQAGVAEIEFVSPLDSPRALLEDVAVLHNRYAMPRANVTPVSIILSLPNARSEYYQVIEDIDRVLGLRCHTLTVATLLIVLWNFGRISGLNDKLFMTKNGGADFSASLSVLLGKSFKFNGEPYPGATYTAK